ncbi:hypothetical protein Tco_0668630, partial [Tanacetum coccineum]
DDDEIAPRRNVVLSFKVPDKNLLTTRTMDDEDAPGLKAVLTFQVPDEVAHEDVDSRDLRVFHSLSKSVDDRIAQSGILNTNALRCPEDDQVKRKQ